MNASDIKIDKEFRDLIAPLTESELEQLHRNLSADGCRDPLVLWRGQNILLDGHNRLEYCRKHDIPFTTVTVRCETRDSAKGWIIINQLGRRNVHPLVESMLRGKLAP